MSGLAAIIRFDGGEVEPGAIERITAAMAYRGPDGIAHWRKGPVALGHLMLRTTAESLEEVQPLANEDESVVLLMDGWLSNWDELRADLLARGAALRTRSDAELVLRAYEVWGEDCPRHIDGEFAFLVWDARRREALCARDHGGLRPLHYHWDGRQLVVASDIGGVVAGPGVPREANQGVIAEFLMTISTTQDETVWKDILRVKPAQWIRFSACSTDTRRYWSPRVPERERYRSDGDYIDHYRALLRDCVRRASRTHRPLACEVSGGLDSSAIFAIAHDLRRNGQLPAPCLRGYSYSLAERGGPADEIDFARAVGAHLGEPINEVRPFFPEIEWFERRAREDCDIAPYPVTAMALNLGQAYADDGCRVVLNGGGGDEWLEGTQRYYTEQAAAFDLAGLARSLGHDVAHYGFSQALRWLIKYGVLENLPHRLKDRIYGNKKARFAAEIGNVEWLRESTRKLLVDRWNRSDEVYLSDSSNRHDNDLFDTLRFAHAWPGRDQGNRMRARSGYEGRSPLFARKFVEFAFATPERLRRRGDIGKHIHRQALEGLLPEMVTARTTKGDYSIAFSRQLDGVEDRLMQAAVDELGLRIVPEQVMGLYRRYRERGTGTAMWHVWAIMGCALGLAAARVGSSTGSTREGAHDG